MVINDEFMMTYPFWRGVVQRPWFNFKKVEKWVPWRSWSSAGVVRVGCGWMYLFFFSWLKTTTVYRPIPKESSQIRTCLKFRLPSGELTFCHGKIHHV